MSTKKEHRDYIDASIIDLDPYANFALKILKQATLDAQKGDFLAAEWLLEDFARDCAFLAELDYEKIKLKAHQWLGNPDKKIIIRGGCSSFISQREYLDIIEDLHSIEKKLDKEKTNVYLYLYLFDEDDTCCEVRIVDIKTKKEFAIKKDDLL